MPTSNPTWRKHFASSLILFLLLAAPWLAAAEAGKKSFDLPADTAERSLKRLAEQSGQEILFPADAVEGVRTREVKGELSLDEALTRLLMGTPLVASHDAQNGVVSVRRSAPEKPGPNDQAAAPEGDRPDSRRRLKREDVEAGANDRPGDRTLELSPFLVTAGDDQGYQATSTLAGTRLKTNLDDLGSAISVVTAEFLRDTGARNSEDLLTMTPGTEVAGTRGNYTAVSLADRDTNETPTLVRNNTNTRVRGLSSADNTRDFFLTDIPWDSYNVERVDLQRGPNSILFGLGNPSGIVNANLNQAGFVNKNVAEVRFGEHGSFRGSLDLNRVLLKDELAIRIDALHDDTQYQQKPAFTKDERVYGALRYDPKFLSRGSAHTTLRINFESGDIEQNKPRTAPPIDRITPWFQTGTYTVAANPATGTPARTFNNLNRSVYSLYDSNNYSANVPNSGIVTQGSPNFQPGASELFTTGVFMFFPTVGSPEQTAAPGIATIRAESNGTVRFGIGPNGAIDGNVQGIPTGSRYLGLTEPWKLAQLQGRPFFGAYTSPSLTDPSIFDFYHKLLDGDSKPSTRNFDALNADLIQSFWDHRVGINLTYNRQNYRDRQDALYDSRWQAITVDLNATLFDGSPNPNAGRPMVVGNSAGNGNATKTQRESIRVQAYVELRAEDFIKNHPLLTSILGKHTFTGFKSSDRLEREGKFWSRMLLGESWGELTGQGTQRAPREMLIAQYLGPDMRSLTSPSGLNLNAPVFIAPTNTVVTYFDSHWNKPTNPAAAGYVNPAAVWVDPFRGNTRTESENPANYVGWKTASVPVLNSLTGDLDQLMRSATTERTKLKSDGFVWQGSFWDNTVVPVFGYRRDTNRIFTVNAPFKSSNGMADLYSPLYVLPTSPRATVQTDIKSWSVVVHTPRFIRDRLPGRTGLSLTYNESSNFNPGDVGRVDMFARPLDPSSGQTKDYGVILSTLNDKLHLRVTRFKTEIKNSTFGWGAPLTWLFNMESEGWVLAKRYEAGLTGNPLYSDAGFNFGTLVNGTFVQSAEDRAAQQAAVTAALAGFPKPIFDAAGNGAATDAKWQNSNYNFANGFGAIPNGFSATRDTKSTGTEFDLVYNPLPNWTISANASHTKAVTRNNVGDLAAWIEERDRFWNTSVAGNLRVFDGLSTRTMRSEWNANIGYPYAFQKYSNGANVQELAPWRFNLATNYRFVRTMLKGASVGGSFRWEDKRAIGYPWIRTKVGGVDTDVPDISQPVYGPTDTTVDLWGGYERKLTSGIKWRIQLNVRNVFGENKLVPTSVQPDGQVITYRIKEGTSWTVTNTFTF